MTKTVNLCNLKKLCYYQFHMHTAMKTIDMWPVVLSQEVTSFTKEDIKTSK